MGQWVVQKNEGTFKAVAGNMKVEKSVQRLSKGPREYYIAGNTRKPVLVTEYELLCHEIGSPSTRAVLVPLHNIVPRQAVHPAVEKQILKGLEHVKELYKNKHRSNMS